MNGVGKKSMPKSFSWKTSYSRNSQKKYIDAQKKKKKKWKEKHAHMANHTK